MAAQVLSGEGSVSYTNSTGQNVRLVINYLKIRNTPSGKPKFKFSGVTIDIGQYGSDVVYGKTLGYRSQGTNETSHHGYGAHSGTNVNDVKPIPLEIALSNGETFAISTALETDIMGYNIIIIPEAG